VGIPTPPPCPFHGPVRSGLLVRLSSSMSLLVLGLSHHQAPVAVRERFAVPESDIPSLTRHLQAQGVVDEVVVVSTCNRVELYVASPLPVDSAAAGLRNSLEHRGAPDSSEGAAGWYRHEGRAVASHLFGVASGLDSMVLGETEILGQLKRSYDVASRHGGTARVLNTLFQSAFHAAKEIRSTTGIQRGNTSVASVAVELAQSMCRGLEGREVMVIGAGETSEKTARALLGRGARSVIVSNRCQDRALALAGELGGRAIRFDAWEEEFARLDILISSTRAPHHILDRPRLERLLAHRARRPLLLIDLAVPRDIDPAVRDLEGVFLVDVDDLQGIAQGHLQAREQERNRCRRMVEERSMAWFEGMQRRLARMGGMDPVRHDAARS